MSNHPLVPAFQKNDRVAAWLIISFSIVVFGIVAALGRMPRLEISLGFDVHLFAAADALINTVVSILLIIALVFIRQRKYAAHRNTMYLAMGLSVLFLLSYIAHHLLAGEAKFGDTDHDGIVSAAELAAVGSMRTVYLIILSSHIILASIILPFILYTAYRGMIGEYAKHKKLARYTWPLWLYVSITGPIVYLMISPYYT